MDAAEITIHIGRSNHHFVCSVLSGLQNALFSNGTEVALCL